MINLIIFGAPGAGKGTQAEVLSKEYKLKHISTGELLREQISKKSPLGEKVKKYLTSGDLAPDNLIIEIIKDTISSKKNNGFIFDGFPRTPKQAEAFDLMLKEKDQSIKTVFVLEVPETELISRLQKRAKDLGRSDDSSLETIKKRLRIYKEKTEELINYYQKQGKAISINGVGSVENVNENIKNEIDKLA